MPCDGYATGPQSGKLKLVKKSASVPGWVKILAVVLVFAGALTGSWFYFKSRVINVWLFTDYAFRYQHANWPALVESRFNEVNRIYLRNRTGVRWKLVDSSQTDPTKDIPGLDNRRTNMVLYENDKADVFVVLTGIQEGDRTGSVSPFARAAVVVDFPHKSETLNARLLAHELAHLFGAPHDPVWLESLMAEKPESNKFSDETLALIRRMRNYPFALGIDALSQHYWQTRALNALAEDDTSSHSNPTAHAHTVLGTALLAERKREDAVEQFRRAVQADPENATAHLNLAAAYTANSQDELALAQVREVVRLSPNDALPHRALGALLGRTHHPDEAVRELQIAARLDPKSSATQLLLGVELAGMFGHLDESTQALQEAVQLNPEAPLARQGLEKVQILKERIAEVLATERAHLQHDPNDPDAHYRLGKAEERVGDLAAATRDFQKAAELRPDSGTPHIELAELYCVTGDFAGAWEEVRKARDLGAEPPPSLMARLPAQK
jgi:Flp pilus assembly protein TadD